MNNNIALKTAKMLDTQNCPQNHIKNVKATKFLLQSAMYTSKGCTCTVLPFYNFWLSFMISSVAPTRSSTSDAYLIAKIGNRNLNSIINFRNSSSNNGLIAQIMASQYFSNIKRNFQ